MKVETGSWRDIQDAKEQLGIGEPPPSGLVPVGDSGLYTTPNTPADPRDCDRYPDSPYCGGNPFNLKPIDIEVSTTVQADECGVTRSISVTPTLGFTKLPPITAAYIPENCREKYENQDKQKTPPPPDQKDGYEPTPQYSPPGFSPNTKVVAVTQDYFFEEIQEYNWERDYWRIATTEIITTFDECKHPGKLTEWYNPSQHAERYTPSLASVTGNYVSIYNANREWMLDYWDSDEEYVRADQVFLDIAIPPDEPTRAERDNLTNGGNYQSRSDVITLRSVFPLTVYYGQFGDIFPRRQISPVANSFTEFKQGQRIIRTRVIHERFIAYVHRLSGDSPDRRPPPLYPPKKKCCEDTMGCCQPQYNNKQEQDLSEIKKMLKELKKRIGTDEYPVKMPASLNADYNDSGKKSEPGTVTEENLTSVLGRFIKYFDGVMGEFGVGFKVADADPTKPGDQPKFIHAPNVAELMSEVYSHVFDMWIMQYQMLHLHQRHAIESMLGRKVGIQNFYALEALIDWAGFKRKDITKKIPFLFDIDAEEFQKFLSNKEQEIQITDFDPNDKNTKSLPDQLMRLNRAAAIIEAVHTRKFGKDDDIPEAIKAILKATSTGLDRVNKDELRTSVSKEDFDQWLRDAENAFINRVGQGDLQNPYGVPYANRPKLTKIHDSLEGGESDGN